MKSSDQSKIKYAYINGMKEGLNLYGSQLNYIQTMWSVRYFVGQIPSQLILHHVPARYYLGTLELVWTLLTFLTVTVSSFPKMCAIRFFIGLLEAGVFPGEECLMGSWYSHNGLTQRSTLFAQFWIAANMISGYLQVAIINELSNKGLVPYKWVFILDGVISLPIALYTMLCNPNTPETTTSWYFNAQDRKIALESWQRIGTGVNNRIN